MSQILIVEDEPRIAAFIAKGLKAAGFATLVEASGYNAVSLAIGGEADLIVLDVGLPDIDGFEVLSRIRGQGVTTPVIMLTAREFTLAEMFLRNPGMVLSREQLLSGAWGYDFDPGSNVVDVYVRYLRQKIGADRVVTVRGMGYRLTTPGA